MNITQIASTLDWRPNNKGTWKALVKDMTPNSTVTFANGYTATVSGRTVSVTNTIAPTGVMTYQTDLADAVSAGALYGAGSVSDSLEAVAGDKTVRMGSVDLGTLTWGIVSEPDLWGAVMPSDMRAATSNDTAVNFVSENYTVAPANTVSNHKPLNTIGLRTNNALRCYNGSSTIPPSGILYYELAEPTTSTETPQSLSLTTGDDTLSGGSFDTTYEGTDYSIPLIRNCKYIHRSPDGTESLVTGSTTNTSINVKGGESKLVNLTHWFGRNREPSIEDFYKLYPTWKTYDIPYDQGSVLNYKGTGVETIGFNAYDHSTGTAALLGGNKYQICGAFTSVSYVDIFGNTETITLDSTNCFTPVDDGTLTVTGGNGTDTCVHLVWSGYKNYGEPEYKWEPFIRNVKELPISTYFPEGMNGLPVGTASNSVDTVDDELTSEQKIQRIGVVDAGTLTWTKYPVSSSYLHGYFSANITDRAKGQSNIACNRYTATADTLNIDNTILGNNANNTVYIIDSSLLSLTPEQLKEALTGCLIYYELATPIVTQLDQPLNLAYHVNDFGTEHSLPQNTTTLVTTDLKALIKYNTDYMRMNSQLSGIFPTVKSLAQQEQDGEIMKTDATAPNATVGNAFNLIDRNAEGTERQFSYDTAGGSQDITDGTAVAKKVMGTTLNLNQLVHDTNENTVESVDGNATVEDAVEGNVKHLVVSGDTVVVNQLVHEYVEKTESGTGRIWIKDAFEKEAKGLKVTAPRSVVMNQLGKALNDTNWVARSASYGTITFESNNVVTVIVNDITQDVGIGGNSRSNKVPITNGHTYLMSVECKASAGFILAVSYPYTGAGITWRQAVSLNNTWERLNYKATAGVSTSQFMTLTNYVGSGQIANPTYSICNFMMIDLTQYFNGNQTLIDSIQTWDDLVAYDSAFASYVPYNTGTVKGVTPALTLNGAAQPFITAPREMFGVDSAGDEHDVVNGKYTQKIGVVDMGRLSWLAYYAPTENDPYGYTAASVPGRVLGRYNILTTKYVQGTTQADKSIYGNTTTSFIYLTDSTLVGKNASEVAASLSGVMLYYELETPVVTDVTPVAFDLVSHDNTIFQTSGDLQSNIEAIYDGFNQTIELDPAHTYAFNHQYVEDSIITGESSIDCVGTEDNLVDLTQLYAGDATRIAAIHSWASLSSRIHMYRDWLPYNPGEIVNLSATIRVYQHEHAYGVVYDPSQSSPVCQKVELDDGVITEVEEFTSLPAHNFRRCVMDDLATRHVNYYLDPLDSTKKADGTPSVLTGADGDVMVEIPITYWRLDEDYNGTGKILWLVSDTPFTGSEIHDFFYVSPNGDEARTQYVGAYRAVVADAEGNALNTTEGAITQNAGTASTRLLRSVAGALPFNNVTLASMREAAVRNGGSHVNRLFHEYLLMMMTIEQASLNCQSISMGYSNGKTNALWAWRKSGRTNYGNGTGQTMAVANTSDDDNFYALKVNNVQLYRDADRDADGYFAWSNHTASPTVYWTESNTPGNGAVAYSDSTGTDSGYTTASWSTTADANKVIQFQYRGIENPFGEVWEFDDGMQKYQKVILTSIKVNNIVHYVNHLKDGTGTKTAWINEDGTSTYWTTTATPGNNSIAYADSGCTVDSGYKTTQNAFVRVDCEMWNTVSVADYTSTDQHTTSSKAYDRKRHYWPSGSWIKRFDPLSFLPRTLGASGSTYLCDNWYNDNGTGSRVVYRGGLASGGAPAGLGYVGVYAGLTYSSVVISGRLSA